MRKNSVDDRVGSIFEHDAPHIGRPWGILDKVKDVSTVKWQIADLGGVDGLRQTRIVRVHGRRGVRDFQDFCLLAELQLEIHPQNGLDAELWIGAQRVTTCALVRTCDPRVGMGIEFVGLN